MAILVRDYGGWDYIELVLLFVAEEACGSPQGKGKTWVCRIAEGRAWSNASFSDNDQFLDLPEDRYEHDIQRLQSSCLLESAFRILLRKERAFSDLLPR